MGGKRQTGIREFNAMQRKEGRMDGWIEIYHDHGHLVLPLWVVWA